jgi:hypothetical protein
MSKKIVKVSLAGVLLFSVIFMNVSNKNISSSNYFLGKEESGLADTKCEDFNDKDKLGNFLNDFKKKFQEKSDNVNADIKNDSNNDNKDKGKNDLVKLTINPEDVYDYNREKKSGLTWKRFIKGIINILLFGFLCGLSLEVYRFIHACIELYNEGFFNRNSNSEEVNGELNRSFLHNPMNEEGYVYGEDEFGNDEEEFENVEEEFRNDENEERYRYSEYNGYNREGYEYNVYDENGYNEYDENGYNEYDENGYNEIGYSEEEYGFNDEEYNGYEEEEGADDSKYDDEYVRYGEEPNNDQEPLLPRNKARLEDFEFIN